MVEKLIYKRKNLFSYNEKVKFLKINYINY